MCRFVALIVVLSVASASAEDWPAFRGPDGTGLSTQGDAPTQWSASQNIAWKAPMPQPGNGSPIVSAGAVFVTSQEDPKGHRRSLYCFDARTGDQRWVRTVDFAQDMPTHATNPHCSTTPVADGKHVVVWHSSAGLYCYDFKGTQVWSRKLGTFRHMWGHGTSPILHDGKVILNSGPGKRVFVGAYSLEDGTTIWEQDEPVEGNGERNNAGHYMGSWSTPVVAGIDGRDQLVCSMATRLNGLDPDTGTILWTCEGIRGPKGDLSYSSPMIGGGLCVQIGGFSGPGFGMRLGGTGNITRSNRLWRNETNPQSIGSGVLIGKHVYRASAARRGPVECLDAATGEIVWSAPAPGPCWSSIVAAGEHLYVTTQQGSTLVFKPNAERFELVSTNHLRDRCNSTIAVADGRLYLRTFGHLYCIGEAAR